MAQTQRKRRRKHRGTQAGTIERSGRAGRPQTKAAAREASRKTRLDREPTWRGSLNRALIAAAIFGVLVSVTSKKPASGILFFFLILIIYVPMTYYIDRAMYKRRQRQKNSR